MSVHPEIPSPKNKSKGNKRKSKAYHVEYSENLDEVQTYSLRCDSSGHYLLTNYCNAHACYVIYIYIYRISY